MLLLSSLKYNGKVRLTWIPPTKFKHFTEAPGNPLEAFSSLKAKHVNWDITVTDRTGVSVSRVTQHTQAQFLQAPLSLWAWNYSDYNSNFCGSVKLVMLEGINLGHHTLLLQLEKPKAITLCKKQQTLASEMQVSRSLSDVFSGGAWLLLKKPKLLLFHKLYWHQNQNNDSNHCIALFLFLKF